MARHRPARLAHMPSIGVDRMGDTADALADARMLRMENLDTDIPPYGPAIAATQRAAENLAAVPARDDGPAVRMLARILY